ncbi:hypothetical protein F511_42893 [Dorcoceras hygrometricum]|uniref:Uncharacterized protein n=1 Tax=Dorcoceras hygrometricum TaxID=472368 RepID=A0A2Z7BMD0_9LAMI|nr:hypothetical protein F511_42893 [Dorcoceras hygrometricum]
MNVIDLNLFYRIDRLPAHVFRYSAASPGGVIRIPTASTLVLAQEGMREQTMSKMNRYVGQQEQLTVDGLERETTEMESWVDKNDCLEQDKSSTQIEMEAATFEGAIVVRFEPEWPAHPSLTFTGSGVFTPIKIREINWVMHFQPKIDLADKAKKVLVPCNKPTPLEEHCQLVLNSAWDDVSARMDVFDEWVHFQKAEEQEQAATGKLSQQNKRIEEIVRTVENVDSTETDSEQEQLGPDGQDQPQQSSTHSNSNYFSISSTSLTPSFHMGVFPSSRISPASDANNTECQGPSPSQLQMIVNIEHRDEAIDFLDSGDDVGSSQANPQQVSISCSPASLTVDVKLQDVEQVIFSLDSRVKSMDSQMKSMNSQVQSLDKRFASLDSKVEDMLNNQTRLKHDFSMYKHAFYENMDKIATNLLELVNHLKESGDAKKGEGGQHRNLEGGQGPSGGQSSTRGRGRGPNPGSYRRGEDSDRFNIKQRQEHSGFNQDKNPIKKSSSILWNQIGRPAKLKAT